MFSNSFRKAVSPTINGSEKRLLPILPRLLVSPLTPHSTSSPFKTNDTTNPLQYAERLCSLNGPLLKGKENPTGFSSPTK